jgi:predicted hotdog family 3-hydroxylacyl-ACP dehydratase
MIDKAGIAARIPHSGLMCLLERVTAWDTEKIHCEAINHRDVNHPLRNEGKLDATAAIEYAAQAMAVHGALIGESQNSGNTDTKPKVGYLASVRDVVCKVSHLHILNGDLQISATRLTGEATRILYEFSVSAGGEVCVTGRAAVVIDVAI